MNELGEGEGRAFHVEESKQRERERSRPLRSSSSSAFLSVRQGKVVQGPISQVEDVLPYS